MDSRRSFSGVFLPGLLFLLAVLLLYLTVQGTAAVLQTYSHLRHTFPARLATASPQVQTPPSTQAGTGAGLPSDKNAQTRAAAQEVGARFVRNYVTYDALHTDPQRYLAQLQADCSPDGWKQLFPSLPLASPTLIQENQSHSYSATVQVQHTVVTKQQGKTLFLAVLGTEQVSVSLPGRSAPTSTQSTIEIDLVLQYTGNGWRFTGFAPRTSSPPDPQ